MTPVSLVFKEVLFPLNSVNEEFALYSDESLLFFDGDFKEVTANFGFQWLPKPKINLFFEADFLISGFPIFQLESNILLPTAGQIVGGNIGRLPREYHAQLIKSVKSWEDFADDYACDRFEFQIPNFQPIFGVQCAIGSTVSMCGHIIQFQDYEIQIHPRGNANELFDDAKDASGYVCTHVGHILKKGAKISLGEAASIATAIGDIISVLVGKNRYPVMLTGVDNENAIVIVPFIGEVDHAQGQETTAYYDEHSFLENVFENYFSLIRSPDWREEIQQLIFWYLQASNWSSPESTVVLTQVALEMASWIELAENGNLISQGGFEALTAADKIRLLSDKLKLNIEYSSYLTRVKDFAKAFQAQTPIDAFVQIRNALVHPKKKNREKISKNGHQKAIYQAGHIGLYILELYLFYKFGFSGRIRSRLTREPISAPWA
jgi:hypothetical protein